MAFLSFRGRKRAGAGAMFFAALIVFVVLMFGAYALGRWDGKTAMALHASQENRETEQKLYKLNSELSREVTETKLRLQKVSENENASTSSCLDPGVLRDLERRWGG